MLSITQEKVWKNFEGEKTRNFNVYQGSEVQVKEPGPSCLYLALAGPKPALRLFLKRDVKPVWDQEVYFITVALKCVVNTSYSLDVYLLRCFAKIAVE